MIKAQVRTALDDCLSYVDDLPSLRYDIMQKVRGEKPVKRKLSISLVIAIALILAAFTALAIAHFNETAGKIANMEAEKGYYETWSADDRVALVRMLVESGELSEDDRVKTLLSGTLDDAAASALATEIITAWGPEREDTITLISILETVKGPMGQWSPEDKAWYAALLRETGLMGWDNPGAEYDPIMPTGDALSQAGAVRVAFDAVVEAYGYDPAYLATYKPGAEYCKLVGLDDQPKWIITFYQPDPKGGYRQYSMVSAVIDPKTAKVVDATEAGYPTPAQTVAKLEITPQQILERTALYDTKGHHYYWTHEERARYMPDRFLVPDADAIPETEAIRLAWEITKNHEQIIPEKLDSRYKTLAIYCTPTEGVSSEPYWAIVIVHEDPNAGPYGTTYGEITIELDWKTGELLGVWGLGLNLTHMIYKKQKKEYIKQG